MDYHGYRMSEQSSDDEDLEEKKEDEDTFSRSRIELDSEDDQKHSTNQLTDAQSSTSIDITDRKRVFIVTPKEDEKYEISFVYPFSTNSSESQPKIVETTCSTVVTAKSEALLFIKKIEQQFFTSATEPLTDFRIMQKHLIPSARSVKDVFSLPSLTIFVNNIKYTTETKVPTASASTTTKDRKAEINSRD